MSACGMNVRARPVSGAAGLPRSALGASASRDARAPARARRACPVCRWRDAVPGYGYGSFNPFAPTQYLQGSLPYGTSPYSTPIPQPWDAPIYSRPYWTGYEGEVSARFADPRFVDARFAPGMPQIPFTQNVPLPFATQNGQIPFTANGQVPFSHSPTAAFG